MTQAMKLLKAFGVLAVLSVLSACSSFTPVYADRSGDALRSVRFNFAEPSSRLEQIILNRLKLAFPGQATPGDPTLDVDASVISLPSSMSTAFAVARPVNIRVQAVASIARNDEVVLEETRFVDTSYQGGKLTPTDLFSKSGAEEQAAEAVAAALEAAIVAKLASDSL